VPKPRISLIAAVAENRAIGKDNQMLWHIPEDLEYFRKITKGHSVMMGRKTFESIGQALSGRTNIIITRDECYQVKDCLVVNSLEKALKQANKSPGGDKEIFIGGGGEIYKQSLPIADRLYLTIVKGNFEADTFFPDYSEFKKVISKTKPQISGKYLYTFLVLEK